MVTDDSALYDITGGPDGVLAGLSHGKVYIDMSSVSPQASMDVAQRVLAVDARMLDAPVSGSVPQVQHGTLAIMVGGDYGAFAQVESLLRQLGQTVTRVGDNGAGVLLKLAINISLAVQTLAFSEGLLLAERGGIDPRLAADVMSSSPIGSPMLKSRVPLLLSLPDHAWFTIRLMNKDIGLAVAEAERLSVALPSTAAAAGVLAEADHLGYSERDIAGLRNVLDEISRSTATHGAATGARP
jgi:3-hydroxyisobutyrate dehydrogenase-like beta-hydroxyacid dehydrogenase